MLTDIIPVKSIHMQTIPIAYETAISPSKLIKVYSRKKPEIKRLTKVRSFYPRVIMPEQPTSYIKQKQNDCW
ncbi:MAG: hypothetical protein ABIR18_05545 [Chitinophagaceae bacterium]